MAELHGRAGGAGRAAGNGNDAASIPSHACGVIEWGLRKPPQPMLRGLFLSETANQNVLSMQTTQATSGRFVDFKQVKAHVSILQVLEHYNLIDTFKQTGDRLSGPCPLHNGNNPTAFRVSISKNCFNCFGRCGRGGNVIDFVALKEGIDFRDAAILLQDWFMGGATSVPTKEPPPAQKVREERSRTVYPPGPTQPETPPQPEQEEEATENPPLNFELTTLKSDHSYLEMRGLEGETIEHFGLGYCSRGILRGHIAIPIHNPDGKLAIERNLLASDFVAIFERLSSSWGDQMTALPADPEAIIDTVATEDKRLFGRKFNGKRFLGDLRAAYLVALTKQSAQDGSPVPIRVVFGCMSGRTKAYKNYKRDEFLVDLSHLTKQGPAETDGFRFELQQTKDTTEGMLLLGAAGQGMVSLLIFKKSEKPTS